MTVARRGPVPDRTRADEVRPRRARVEAVVEPAPRERRPRPARTRPPRRRHDLALPAQLGAELRLPSIPLVLPPPAGRGAELRLPSIPVVRPGPRVLSAVLLALTAWALQSVLAAGSFRVAEASVSGARLLRPSQVRSLARVDGESVFLLDPRDVVHRLLQEPEVGEAEVSIGWPNRVEITIHERIPVVEWDDGDLTWWVSSE